jgi:Outer membrane protein beta-barrel domain
MQVSIVRLSLFLIDKNLIQINPIQFMKKLALVLLAGFSFAAAHAQFAFGIKGGANFSNVNGSDVSGTSSLVGFNAGVYLKLPVTKHLSIQPEVVYSGQGFKATNNGVTGSQHENYINIPVLLKYHVAGVFIETGPQAGILASAKVSQQGVSVDDKGSFNSADFSWVFGAGVKIPMTPISLDARYNLGLSNIINNGGNSTDNSTAHNGSFQIGIMINLFSAPIR